MEGINALMSSYNMKLCGTDTISILKIETNL